MSTTHALITLWDPGVLALKPPPASGSGLDGIDGSATAVPEMEAKIKTIVGWAKWGVMVAGVGGLLWCAGKMAIGSGGRSQVAADGAADIPKVLIGLSLAAAAIPILAALWG